MHGDTGTISGGADRFIPRSAVDRTALHGNVVLGEYIIRLKPESLSPALQHLDISEISAMHTQLYWTFANHQRVALTH